MSIDAFLNSLEKVRSRGSGNYMACCPCHEDKRPSLSIRDHDGIILIKCFGCGASGNDVADHLGIDISELFPPSDENYTPQKRHLFSPAQVLESLSREAFIVMIVAKDMQATRKITDETMTRLAVAVERIYTSIEYTKNVR